LFRELLDRELPALQWRRLFRTLRVMELSGEVMSGQFFEGIQGLQFASPALVRSMRDGIDDDRVVWMCATDPASPCGLGMEVFAGLPRRLPIHHLVFRGKALLLVSERRGRRLDIRVAPDDPVLGEAFGFVRNLLTRRVLPAGSVTVDTINGEAAADSPYRPVLETQFHVVRDRKMLRLMRRY
jgi:ATP-dependent Lhr-like helicase